MIHKVFIALTQQDLNLAIKKATKHDFILSIYVFNKEGQHIDARFKDVSDESLVPQVTEWFHN